MCVPRVAAAGHLGGFCDGSSSGFARGLSAQGHCHCVQNNPPIERVLMEMTLDAVHLRRRFVVMHRSRACAWTWGYFRHTGKLSLSFSSSSDVVVCQGQLCAFGAQHLYCCLCGICFQPTDTPSDDFSGPCSGMVIKSCILFLAHNVAPS